jgi:CDP-diglyceride synthetase
VGLPIVGALVFWHDSRGFTALCLLAALLALAEYTALTMPGRPLAERMRASCSSGVGCFLGSRLRPGVGPRLAVRLRAGDWRSCCCRERPIRPAAWTRMAQAGFGVFYVGGLLAALPLLHARMGSAWVALAIAVTFGNDTGAYFAGRAFGRHKLAPAISPGKTVEGAVGGLVASLALSSRREVCSCPRSRCATAP